MSVREGLKKAGRGIVDLIFPPRCPVCGRIMERKSRSDALCDDCFAVYLKERVEKCTRCGMPYDVCFCTPDGFVPEVLVYGVPYDSTLPVTKSLVLSMKRRRNVPAARLLASATVKKAMRVGGIPKDAIVSFVPRSPEKKRKYGTDQAEELAAEVCSFAGLDGPVKLIKHRSFTKEQKTLGATGRAKNARTSYAPVKGCGKKIDGRCVLLVDDVVTTGATLNACAGILTRCGAAGVICLAAARRDDHGRQSGQTPETPD
ncbi:MAG: ComF family protein [Clostridia bacterium]|nr:ComF family protein [Clostridia bacterium]